MAAHHRTGLPRNEIARRENHRCHSGRASRASARRREEPEPSKHRTLLLPSVAKTPALEYWVPALRSLGRDDSRGISVIMSIERSYWVYFLASRIGGTLYIGGDESARSASLRPQDGPRRRLHEEVSRQSARIFRAIRRYQCRDCPRKAAEEVEAGLENSTHRETQSELGRSLSADRAAVIACLTAWTRRPAATAPGS